MVVWNLANAYGENFLFLKFNSFSDFWKLYNYIPKSTHQKVGEETGCLLMLKG
jgi:hypothetical protein